MLVTRPKRSSVVLAAASFLRMPSSSAASNCCSWSFHCNRIARFCSAVSSLDSVFVTFAAHEVRDTAGQRALFTTMGRALRPGGQLIVTEHPRDAANFAVYGPGALHFQPLATWHARAAEAGLTQTGQMSITPFVKQVVFRR